MGCEGLTGLDQISVSACAPFCGDDAGANGDGSPASGDPDSGASRESADAAPEGRMDATAGEDATRGDDGASGGDDATPPDAEADASEEAAPGGDASIDGAVDASTDSGGHGVVDAGPDARGDTGADAGPCGTVYFQDSFDQSPDGWTLDPTWSIAPTCASPPAPQKGNPDPTVDHTTGTSGGVVAAFACGNNPTGATAAARYAVSPVIDVSQAPSVVLTFYRWLNSDTGTYMASTVDVYDGSAWVNLYTNPSGSIVADAAWTKVQFDVSAYKNAKFQVRFGYSLGSTQVYAMSCWNVDDVTVSSIACP